MHNSTYRKTLLHTLFCSLKLSKAFSVSIIESEGSKISSQLYYKHLFQNSNLYWNTIYVLLQVFQYKLLSNVLYLTTILFSFRKIDSPLCPFCKMIDETPLHLFCNCTKSKIPQKFISNRTLSIPSLMPQGTIVGQLTSQAIIY